MFALFLSDPEGQFLSLTIAFLDAGGGSSGPAGDRLLGPWVDSVVWAMAIAVMGWLSGSQWYWLVLVVGAIQG